MTKLSLLMGVLCVLVAGRSGAVNFDNNVPQEIQKQMVEDLSFMAGVQGRGQTPLHQEIFGPVGGQTYRTFFDTRITAIGLNSCGGGNAVACVMPFVNPNKMWLTQNFIKFSHPQVARSMVVYHEARHSETKNGNWGHDNCPTPFLDDQGKDKASIWTGAKLEGQPACDSTPYGSYGSSTILLKNISKFCSNCTDKVRMDAELYSQDQLGRINNAPAKQAMIRDFNSSLYVVKK